MSRADELNAIGAELHLNKGQIDVAKMHYLAALNVDPNHVSALQNLGAALVAMEKYEASASISRRAVAVAPDNFGAWGNLAVSYGGLRKYAKAIEIFERILPKIPRHQAGGVMHNYALNYHMQNKHTRAEKIYDEALSLLPNNLAITSDRALSILCQGRMNEGLSAYEVRWKSLYKSHIWKLELPEWQGQSLNGKRIIMHHEQGYGDSLMYCRFVKDLQQMGAKVTVAVPDILMELVQDSFQGIKVVDWEDKNLDPNDYDYHTPMMSVMRWLKLEPSEIDPSPYLKAKKWQDTLVMRLPKTFKIGLCWFSGDHGKTMASRRRYAPLNLFLPITEIPGVKVISLQKEDGSQEVQSLGVEGWIVDYMQRMDSFADTASMVQELDLVISVDSAVAHLAGGMGIPTIMLSPYTRCWRWWNASDEKGWSGLPWYQDMRVIPQSEDGSWDAAAEQATDIVSTIVKGKQ